MVAQQLVEILYQSWADLDHAIEGLDASDAEAQHHGLGRIAWTVGHLGQQVDSWFNVRFADRSPHALLGQALFHTGGRWRGAALGGRADRRRGGP